MLADVEMQAALQDSGSSSRNKTNGGRQKDAARKCYNLPSSCPYPQLWWPVITGQPHPAELSTLCQALLLTCLYNGSPGDRVSPLKTQSSPSSSGRMGTAKFFPLLLVLTQCRERKGQNPGRWSPRA